jgi:cysteinyl-tRNA synthetase
VSLLTLL